MTARFCSDRRRTASHQKLQTAISVGATMLTALLGRKRLSQSTLGRATTAMRGAGRAQREAMDASRARQSLDDVLEEIRQVVLVWR